MRSKTRTLVELGQLEPVPCKVCGAAEVQAHHLETQRALGYKNINSTVSYLSFREEEID